MPAPIHFTAPGLSLLNVQQTAVAAVTVTFSGAALAVSPLGTHDALNPNNYSISGPSTVSIQTVQPTADPSVFILIVTKSIDPGTYTLTVSAIQGVNGSALTSPTSMAFSAFLTSGEGAANKGALNDDAEGILRKHLSKAFDGPFWRALIHAVAKGDQRNFDDARKAYNQRFLSSASGSFLDRKAGDNGLIRPIDLGMSDELFREYAIFSSTGKVTQQSLLELMEIFFGQDALRAYAQSTVSSTYSLSDGDDLQILLDEDTAVSIIFRIGDFNIISAATAIEVAAATTRQLNTLGLDAYAVAYTDPQSGLIYVRIYSASLGLISSVRITGGKAQNIFKFPTLIPIQGPIGTVWVISNPSPNTFRFSTTNTDAGLDLNQVYAGCYVNIYGAAFAANNRGSFQIQAVSVTYPGGTKTQTFDIINTAGSTQTVTSLALSDVLFYFPTKNNTNASNGRTVVVAQTGRNSLEVRLPATAQSVSRTPPHAAYLKTNTPTTITAIQRLNGLVTVTAAGHGVGVGNTAQFIVDGVIADDALPSTIAGVPSTSGNPGTSDASLESIWATTRSSDINSRYLHSAVVLPNNDVLVTGGAKTTSIGGAETQQLTCERFRITAVATLGGGQVQYTYNWIAAASRATALSRSAAVLLQDGRAAVFGGWDGAASSNVGQIYDPTGNSWTSTHVMNNARAFPTATVLANGSVFVAGGANSAGTASLVTTELYAVPADTFTAKTSLNFARCNHTATLLKNGKVLLVGGRNLNAFAVTSASNGTQLSTCEIYDPGGNTMVMTGRMAFSRTDHTATILPDGRVVVIGGWGTPATQPGVAAALITPIEIYDPNVGQWYIVDQLVYPRWQHQANLLANGTIVISGGSSNSDGKTPNGGQTEYLNTSTMKLRVAPMAMGTHAAGGRAVLSQGAVVWTGGMGAGGTLDNAQLYIQANDVVGSGQMNGVVTATGVSSSVLTYSTDNTSYTNSAAGTLTAFKAASSPAKVPGPYVFDPMSGLGITAMSSTLTAPLYRTNHYNFLPVTSSAQFPDLPGYVVIGFGTAYQTVIAYQGRFSGTALALDATLALPADLPVNADVTWLVQRGPFVPADTSELGAFYLTASNSGRERASAALDEAMASGFGIDKVIVFPGDRGLGNEGWPSNGETKLSDEVEVWGSDNLDEELAILRGD